MPVRSGTRCAWTACRWRCYAPGSAAPGPATVVPGGLHAFIKTRPELAAPDIEFMFRGAPPHAHLWFPLLKPAYADGFGIRPTLLHPESRGEVRLRSADPRAHPRILFNLLTEPADIARLRDGFKRAREVALQVPLDALSRRRNFAGREGSKRHAKSMPGFGGPA